MLPPLMEYGREVHTYNMQCLVILCGTALCLLSGTRAEGEHKSNEIGLPACVI